MNIVDLDKLSEMFWDGNFMEIHKDDIPTIPSAFEGMTNRKVLQTLFPQIELGEIYNGRHRFFLKGKEISTFDLKAEVKWLDSPYKGGSE